MSSSFEVRTEDIHFTFIYSSRHKWNQFQWLFYFNLIFYCTFLGLITTYVLYDLEKMRLENVEQNLLNLKWAIIIVIAVGLVLELIDLLRVNFTYF